MKKTHILLVSVVFLLSLCFLTEAVAEWGYIVKEDAFGAYTKEGITKLINIIMAKDSEALSKLAAERQIFMVKKGTKVFIEERFFGEGFVRVRSQGQTTSFWLLGMDLEPEEDRSEVTQDEPNKKTNSD